MLYKLYIVCIVLLLLYLELFDQKYLKVFIFCITHELNFGFQYEDVD